MTVRRLARWLKVFVLAVVVLLPTLALAGPRSGGSFSGRSGFRSGGGFSSAPRSYSGGGSSYRGGGSHFVFLPGWGWGGMGYGGGSLFGTLFLLAAVGIGAAMVMRAVRRARQSDGSVSSMWGTPGDDEAAVEQGRAYLYKLQLALGRSARGVQDRLADFAAKGDTSSEAGLASLLQQTALELLRNKDSIRYAAADGRGPMSLTNAETALNGISLSERSRFQVERVRAADGRASRSEAPAEEGKEALELVVVTLVAATRTPLDKFKAVSTVAELDALLSELGGVSPQGLLGLEVVWTPADANDSMTETDVMTTYPELRSL